MDIKYGRKRSGIRKELDQKLEAWLESISDAEIRRYAKRDVIVTGGSIASMLMGDPVNDFDLYFRTKDTTKKVAEYYVKKFNESNPDTEVSVREETITNCRGSSEDRVVIWVQSQGIVEESATDSPSDEEPAPVGPDIRAEEKEAYRPVFLSQNAITLSDKVQLVIRFYGEPEQIHDNYDFVHATCFYDYHQKNLVFPAEALEAMLSRTLIYRGSLYPIASIFRMKKFLERGWRISAGQQLKIMWQISELNLRDPSVLREQLTGVDQAYLYMLIEALSGVESEKLCSQYVAAVIDRIFE